MLLGGFMVPKALSMMAMGKTGQLCELRLNHGRMVLYKML